MKSIRKTIPIEHHKDHKDHHVERQISISEDVPFKRQKTQEELESSVQRFFQEDNIKFVKGKLKSTRNVEDRNV
jgi:hypothetical protein